MALNEKFLLDLEDIDESSEGSEDFHKQEMMIEDQQIPQIISDEQINKKIEEQQLQQKQQQLSNNQWGSQLLDNQDYLNHIEKVNEFLNKTIEEQQFQIEKNQLSDEEYQLILKSNEYSNIIDRELANVQKQVRDIYYEKFPELEQLVLNPVDYAKCIQRIQNEVDLNRINLHDIVSNHQIVTIKITGSSTSGKVLSKDKLANCLLLCDIILKLDQQQKHLLKYVQQKMELIAPNLCSIIGSNYASRLISAAGGIIELARIPACNIQVMGGQKKNLLGLSKANSKQNFGIFGQMEMVKKAPKEFQTKLVRMFSTNCAKAIRADAAQLSKKGDLGRMLKEQILQRFSKIQEPPPPKLLKPLVAPDSKLRRRRGGKRYRHDKDRLAMTEIRKYKNRMTFGPEAQKEIGLTGEGFGQLGFGTAKVKLEEKANQKIGLTKKQKKSQQQYQGFTGGMSGGATCGLSSSIAFTPVQGMELINPETLKPQVKKIDKYFKKESGFSTVTQEKLEKNALNKVLGGKSFQQ